MKVLKFFVISSLCVSLCVFFALFLLRTLALKTDYHDRELFDFFRVQKPIKISSDFSIMVFAQDGGSHEAPSNTLVAFDRAVARSSSVGLHLTVHLTKDDQFVLGPNGDLSTHSDGRGSIEQMGLEEVQRLDAGYQFKAADGSFPFRNQNIRYPKLSEFLTRYKNPTIIALQSNVVDIHKKFIAFMKTQASPPPFLVQSDYDLILQNIKNLEPHWCVGLAKGELTRSFIMDSLFLEPAMTLSGDLFITPGFVQERPLLSDSLMSEIRRRRLPIYLSSINEGGQLGWAIDHKITAILTERPNSIITELAELAKTE